MSMFTAVLHPLPFGLAVEVRHELDDKQLDQLTARHPHLTYDDLRAAARRDGRCRRRLVLFPRGLKR